MLNIGVIGCGKIAQVRHIPEYAANEQARLAAFYNPTRSRAEQLAAQYGGKVYDSAEELLADASIDAVSICSANYSHAALAIQALEAGKDVLCEKPMATTWADCLAMAEAAKKSGRRLLIGQNQRLAKAHVLAKQLLEEGLIGKVLTFRTAFGHGGPETWSIHPGKDTWFFDKHKAVMGVMADLGIHKTDLICYLLGEKIVKTSAVLTTLDKRGSDGELIGVDDNAFCIYTLAGGATGTLSVSWTHYGAEDNSTVLYGTGGIMRIYDDPAHSIVVRLADGTERFYDVEQIQTNDNQTSSGVIDEFVSAVVEGRESILDVERVLGSMQAVFASIDSSRDGRPVEL